MKPTPMMLQTYDAMGPRRACQGLLSNHRIYNIFEDKLKRDYDLIMIGKIKWSTIPATFRIAILRKVHDGTGLVYINPPEIDRELAKLFGGDKTTDCRDAIVGAVPLEMLPALKDIPKNEVLKLNSFGKGRVAWIDYRQKTTLFDDYYRHCLTPREGYGSNGQLIYDYCMSLLAKASLWAAGKSPDIMVNGIRCNSERLDLVCSSSVSSQLDLEFVVKDGSGEVEHNQERSFAFRKGDNSITLELPLLQEGIHFIDFWIRRDDQIVNWGSTYVKTEAKNAISSLTLDKERHETGGALSGTVLLKAPLSLGRLLVHLIDNYGRIMAARELKGPGTAFTFHLRIDDPLSILLKVRARLCDDMRILSEKTVEFPVPTYGADDFSFGIWGPENDEYLSQLVLDTYSRYAIDTVHDISALPKRLTDNDRKIIARNIAKANLKIIPMVWSFFNDDFYDKTENGPARRPSLSDPAYIKRMTEYLRRATRMYSMYGPAAYNLGDENCVSAKVEVGYGPLTLREFRKYLKGVYRTLEQLNETWSSSFEPWDHVMPANWKQARELGKYASWLDHRLFMEKAFADIHVKAAETIRGIDRAARVGFEGPLQRRPSTGYDFYRLFRELDFFCLYPAPVDRFGLLNSFKGENSLTGSWFGGYDGSISNDYMRSFPWSCLFAGMNSCHWFGGVPVKGAGGNAGFTPDLSPFEYFLTASDEIREIRSGLGKLLLNCRRETGPVAIYYSPLAKYAYAVAADKAPATYGDSIDSFCYLLKDLGIEPRFISNTEIEEGKLTQDFCQALILPSARALARHEAAMMENYTRGGGTVIADLPPGTMDTHCAVRKESLLKSLFGGFTSAPGYNTPGKGKAVYVGTFFGTYIAERLAGTAEDKRRVFLSVLENSGITPEVKINGRNGTQLRAVTTAIFRGKDAAYIGFLYFPGICRSPAKRVRRLQAELATIRFPAKYHVYGVREKEYFGHTDTIQTRMRPSHARVFALLPERIESIALKTAGARFRGGDKVEYHFALSPPVSSSARLELISPMGRKLSYHARNILFEGKHNGVIPLAINATPGEYTIQIEDVVTGKSARAKFTVAELESSGDTK